VLADPLQPAGPGATRQERSAGQHGHGQEQHSDRYERQRQAEPGTVFPRKIAP
jgi:hypothetical protein